MAASPASTASSLPSDFNNTNRQLLSEDSTLVNTSRISSFESVRNDIPLLAAENGPAVRGSSDAIQQSSILSRDDVAAGNIADIPTSIPTTVSKALKVTEPQVGWRDLPKKGQLAVLTLARLSEPLADRSLAAYIFYQLRSFDPSLSESTITSQGGLLTAAFAGAQFFTAVWWGRLADNPKVGRKNVIIIGLSGSAVAMLGIGFSKSFAQAIIWRIFAGALNGNTGVMRTMVSEMIQERRFQSRAFLLLPMTFNIGVIIGPLFGGFLADPVASFPKVFGPGSSLGGREGVGWMLNFPYALPNLFSSTFIFMAVLGIIFGLDETHHQRRHSKDWGRRLTHFVSTKLFGRQRAHHYQPVEREEAELYTMSTIATGSEVSDTRQQHQRHHTDTEEGSPSKPGIHNPTKAKTGIRAIMTPNVTLTLLSHYLLALHISTFNTLIFLFLPNPPSTTKPATFFSLRFSGGVGLSSEKVGMATAIMGVIGFPLQILAFPRINTNLGTLGSYRWFIPFSAIAYTAIPFLALVHDKPAILWPSLTLILACQVLARTFALPSTTILINNSSPSPAVLGTVHGVAQSVSSAARMLGPTLGGWGLGLGLGGNCVGAVWWVMACIVGCNWSLLWLIWEGDGRGGKA